MELLLITSCYILAPPPVLQVLGNLHAEGVGDLNVRSRVSGQAGGPPGLEQQALWQHAPRDGLEKSSWDSIYLPDGNLSI